MLSGFLSYLPILLFYRHPRIMPDCFPPPLSRFRTISYLPPLLTREPNIRTVFVSSCLTILLHFLNMPLPNHQFYAVCNFLLFSCFSFSLPPLTSHRQLPFFVFNSCVHVYCSWPFSMPPRTHVLSSRKRKHPSIMLFVFSLCCFYIHA